MKPTVKPINSKAFKSTIIHLPSYLLGDLEMFEMISRLNEIQNETGNCLRAQDAINDLRAELRKRG